MPNVNQLIWAARMIGGTLRPRSAKVGFPITADGSGTPNATDGSRAQVAAFYQARMGHLKRNHEKAILSRARYFCFFAAFCVILAILLYLSLAGHFLPIWPAVLPVVPAIFSIEKARRCKNRARDAISVLGLYQRRLDRVRHEWMGKGDPGSDLEMPEHPSARDLDFFGEGSMFELLCDVETPSGRETLAKWLQFPASREEAIARQQSVRCLRDRIKLREALARLREGEASEFSWNKLREWLVAAPVKLPRWAPWVGLALSLSLGVVAGCWGAGILQAADAVWVLALIVAGEIGLAQCLRSRVRSILAVLLWPARKVESLRRFSALVQEEQLDSPQLTELQRKLRGSSERIARLERLLRLIELRRDEWLFYLLLLLLWTTQWTVQLEWWRERHGRELVEWMRVLGEFESLMAIAAYAYENPVDPFPELADDGPLFEATAIGHPLIDARTCVRNDLKLGGHTGFLMITGSNMSGKSTLLRTVGLNATLAWMGAPVRASRLRVSDLQVCTSIGVEDSLLHGASHFYAEVQRLKATLDRARAGQPVLFLIDELFGGTNSADRRTAAEAVIRSLVEHKAIGLVTSHDLALSEIGEMQELKGANVRFTDLPSAEGFMKFDYRIYPGKLEHGSALTIVKLMGLLPQ
jgi:hypothetical protein